jgi:O-antigen/teichoic acid export membrane protein
MNEGLSSQSISGIKWSVIERFSVQGIQFVIGLLLARLLTPSDYGIFGLLAIFMAISQTIIDSGFSKALIQKRDRTETDFSTTFFFNIVVGVICYLALFVASPYIASFFNEPILRDILPFLAINLFLNSLVVVPVAKLSIRVDFKTLSKASVISTATSGTLGIILAYNDAGVYALVVQSVSYSFINVLLLWYLLRWIPQRKFSWKSFKTLFTYGGNVLVASIISTIYDNINTLVIGKFYTPKDLGYFTRGQQFPSLLSTNLTSIVQRVTFPILSKIQDDDNRLSSVYRDYIKMSSLVIFFLLIFLGSIAKPLIILLLTETWADAVIYLQVFCYALMFDHISAINLNLLYVKGKTNLVLRLEVIKKSIAFFILLVSIPFGVFAICFSKVVYCQIAIYINTYYTGKLLSLGYIKQLKDYIPYFFIAHMACLPSWFLQYADDLHPILQILVGGILAITLYVIILCLIKDRLFSKFVILELKKRFS